MQTPQPSTVLRGHVDAVNALCFFKLNNIDADSPLHLLSGSSDGYVNIWNVGSRKMVKSFLAHSHSVLSISYHKNSNKFITFGRDGILKTWDVENVCGVSDHTQALESYNTGSFQFCNATCNKYNDIIINEFDDLIVTPSSNDGEILLWDMRTKNVISSIKSDSYGRNVGMVTSLLLQSTTTTYKDTMLSNMNLLAGYEDGSLSYIDLKQMKPISNISLNQNPILAIDISKDGKFIMSAGADKDIHQLSLNVSTGDLKMKKQISLPTPGTGGIKIRMDGRIFGSAHWDNTVRIYQSNLKPLAILRHHRESVFAVEFANCIGYHHLVATGSKDKTIAIWNNLFENTMKHES